MKILKLTLLVLVLFVSATIIACQGTTPVKNTSDYYAGKKTGEAYAKQDAMDLVCFNAFPWTTTWLKRNVRNHIAAMDNNQSESFIRGFYWGYKNSYLDYVDTYCGD